ncbi:MAG: hypothetical protein IPN29_04825 [Saprospiraceae bacterium]|nr:hypothetical protein [Saprospiraceae bacterium]
MEFIIIVLNIYLFVCVSTCFMHFARLISVSFETIVFFAIPVKASLHSINLFADIKSCDLHYQLSFFLKNSFYFFDFEFIESNDSAKILYHFSPCK